MGVLDKVGTFGMIRYCLELFPAAARYFTPLVIVMAVVGVLYGAMVAIGQRDMKRLIAYTSVSHFGFIALGIFVLTSQGQSGATLYMVNHGFATGALFLIAGFMIVRRRSHLINDYGGVQKVAPVLAGLFLIAGLAGLSLPGLSTFVSEFLVLVGTFTKYKAAAVAATVAIILVGDLHPVDVPAHHDRARCASRSRTSVTSRPGSCGRRAADRAGHRVRRLPEAAARTSSTRRCTGPWRRCTRPIRCRRIPPGWSSTTRAGTQVVLRRRTRAARRPSTPTVIQARCE